jgi:hypothetical protein
MIAELQKLWKSKVVSWGGISAEIQIRVPLKNIVERKIGVLNSEIFRGEGRFE